MVVGRLFEFGGYDGFDVAPISTGEKYGSTKT